MTADSEAVHLWFGLTYSNYAVLPRTLLQSMPGDWQERFVACMHELDAAFDHVEQPGVYKVEAAEARDLAVLTGAELAALGITRREVPCSVVHDHDENYGMNCNDEVLYDSAEREGMYGGDTVLVPIADPLPHYNRGRARIEPDLASITAEQDTARQLSAAPDAGLPDRWTALREHVAGVLAAFEELSPVPGYDAAEAAVGCHISACKSVLAKMDELAGESR